MVKEDESVESGAVVAMVMCCVQLPSNSSGVNLSRMEALGPEFFPVLLLHFALSAFLVHLFTAGSPHSLTQSLVGSGCFLSCPCPVLVLGLLCKSFKVESLSVILLPLPKCLSCRFGSSCVGRIFLFFSWWLRF